MKDMQLAFHLLYSLLRVQGDVCMKLLDSLFKKNKQEEKNVVKHQNRMFAPSENIDEEERPYYKEDRFYTMYTKDLKGNKKPVITYEKRKETSNPSKHGLYVGDLILLAQVNKFEYPRPKEGYPIMLWFQYGIRDVGNHLKNLEQQGFIRKSLNIENQMVYKLSDLGKQELMEHAYVPYMHNHAYRNMNDGAFNVWTINKELQGDVSKWKEVVGNYEESIGGIALAPYFDERYYLDTNLTTLPICGKLKKKYSLNDKKDLIVFYNSNKQLMSDLTKDDVSYMKYGQLAKDYMSIGDFKHAMLDYEVAIRKESKDTSLFINYAKMLIAFSINKKALLVLKKCLHTCDDISYEDKNTINLMIDDIEGKR